MAVGASTGFFLGLPKYRPQCRHTGSRKALVSEYCAIEKMDRLLLSTDRADETELIGLSVREMRRREILFELATWLAAAEDVGKSTSLAVR
jgi:hypothetical protein